MSNREYPQQPGPWPGPRPYDQWTYPQPGFPGGQSWYSGYGPQPPKRKTGLIVAVVAGFLVLVGLGVGAIFLFTGDESSSKPQSSTSKPDSKKSPTGPIQISAACPLLSTVEISDLAGFQGFLPNEDKPERYGEGALTGTKYTCNYNEAQDREQVSLSFNVSVYDRIACEPQACVEAVADGLVSLEPVTGIDFAAIRFKNREPEQYQFITSAKTIGTQTVVIVMVGPEPSPTAEQQSKLLKTIFRKIEESRS